MTVDRKPCLQCGNLMIEVLGARLVNGWVPCNICGYETFFNEANQALSPRLIQTEDADPSSHIQRTQSLDTEERAAGNVNREAGQKVKE
jgi:hypothetical protein